MSVVYLGNQLITITELGNNFGIPQQMYLPPLGIEYILIAGGGSGGNLIGGGGGAGAYLTGSYTASFGTTFNLTIGAGGSGSNGTNSTLSTALSLTAIGGGKGGDGNQSGFNGGNGGGGGGLYGASTLINSGGLSLQNLYAGGTGSNFPLGKTAAGGGGGASQRGYDQNDVFGGAGGNGITWLDGLTYAGGGGGAGYSGDGGTGGAGGTGGGGTGTTDTQYGGNATINTGAGGGGGEYGGLGSNGIAKFRYSSSLAVCTGGLITQAGGYVYHTFISGSGSLLYNGIPTAVPGTASAAQQFIEATGITGSAVGAINVLYSSLVTASLFDKMYAIYPFVGANSTAHSYNLVNTGSYQLGFNGTWVHNSNGVTSNGTNAWATTQFTPSSKSDWGVSSSMHIYSRTDAASGCDMGSYVFGNKQSILFAKYTTGNAFVYNVSGNGSSIAMPNSTGLFSGNIYGTPSGSSGLYKNGTKLVGFTGSGGDPISSVPLYLAANSSNFNPELLSARNYALAAIGKGLTQTEVATLYTIVQSFETTMSRQV
jgi:hypothetical protein